MRKNEHTDPNAEMPGGFIFEEFEPPPPPRMPDGWYVVRYKGRGKGRHEGVLVEKIGEKVRYVGGGNSSHPWSDYRPIGKVPEIKWIERNS